MPVAELASGMMQLKSSLNDRSAVGSEGHWNVLILAPRLRRGRQDMAHATCPD